MRHPEATIEEHVLEIAKTFTAVAEVLQEEAKKEGDHLLCMASVLFLADAALCGIVERLKEESPGLALVAVMRAHVFLDELERNHG